MAVDRERQQLVKEGVAVLSRYWADNKDRADVVDEGTRPETLAEALALLAAEARHAGVDEGVHAEITLKTCNFDRDDLNEARRVLEPLGYDVISGVLKRLARTAPPRRSWLDRMRERRKSRLRH